MRFNKLDLNLLVALDVLLHEQSISRSAVRLHVTQPAMSNALGRLRDYFDDDLLVQVGRRMELTPFAETLKEAVHDVLLRVNSTITSRPKFEPAESEREFRIFVSDYTMATLMPSVLARARAANAKVRFAFLPQLEDPDGALSRGEVDVVVLPRDYCAEQHPAETLYRETFSCVVWNESPLAHGKLTLERYAKAGHIVMRPPGSRHASFEERYVQKLGIHRRTALETYSFAIAPQLVVGTDLVATVHARLATAAAGHLPLTVRKPPFDLPPMDQAMQWHRYKTKDPGIAWLRGILLDAGRSLTADAAR